MSSSRSRVGLGVVVGLAALPGTASAAVTISGPATTAEGNTASFTVRQGALEPARTVNLTLSGSAACEDDAAFASGGCTTSVSLNVLNPSDTVAVETFDDRVHEGNESLTVSGAGASATTTIVDDDAKPVVSVADAAAGEGEDLVFTLTKAGQTALPATVHYAVAPGAGTEAADLGTPLEGDVMIPADATSATVSIPTTEDLTDEPDETVALTLSVPAADANATLGDATATGTISDDDDPPAATLAAASVTEGDTASFGVTLARASELPVALPWTVTPGTASAADLADPETGTLTIPAGATAGTIPVGTVEDTTYEGDEAFAVGTTGTTAGGTIVEDDPKPTLSIGDAQTVGEGGTLSFPVTKAGATALPARAAWSATGDVSGPTSGVVELAAAAGDGAIAIPTASDALDEDDEPVTVTLTALPDGHATLGAKTTGTGTVTDDDTAAVAVGAGSAEEAAGLLLVPITLSTPSDRNVSVAYRTEAGTATAGADYEDRNGRITVPAGQTAVVLPVPLVDDADIEGDETFDVVVSDAAPAGTQVATARATQTVRSADAPAPPPTPGPAPPAAPVAAQGPRFPTDDRAAPKPGLTGLKLKGSTLSLRFACPASERLCRGTLAVLTVPNAKAKDKRLRKELALGTRVAVVPGGKTATFTLKLSKARRALLKKGGSVQAVAYAVVRDAAGNVGTAQTKATLKAK